MAGYTLSQDIGDDLEDVTVATGGTGLANFTVSINDGISRSDAIRALHQIADKLDASDTDEPPAAFS